MQATHHGISLGENSDFCCGQILGDEAQGGVCSLLHHFLCFAHLRFSSSSSPGKGQMKPGLCFLALSVNPNPSHGLSLLNRGKLLLSQAIPASVGTAPNHYSSILCEKRSKLLSHPIAPKINDFLCEKCLLVSDLQQLVCCISAEVFCTGSFSLLCLISDSKGIIKEEE